MLACMPLSQAFCTAESTDTMEKIEYFHKGFSGYTKQKGQKRNKPDIRLDNFTTAIHSATH